MKNANIFRKDESLDRLAAAINVAQFVSFSPGDSPGQEYSRVLGFRANHKWPTLKGAIEALLNQSPEKSVNVRSFLPDSPKSNEFIYGLQTVAEVERAVRRICSAGLFVIVNETIDVRDGGVSGVVQGGVLEFSPDDTPRCVEKPGVASLPVGWGIKVLESVYGFPVPIDLGLDKRLEFSIHPSPRGWKASHVLGWELETVDLMDSKPSLGWPNNFSRLIGDKAYGLLVASMVGLPVPKTTVISRRVAPFTFGKSTENYEKWLRTCPIEQVPGKFTTHRGWIDPFLVFKEEDPSSVYLSSVLSQDGVLPLYSGALIVGVDGGLIIEGRAGEGEVFMRGEAVPEDLPSQIRDSVVDLYISAMSVFGPVRFEWVHDGIRPWILQLHRGATKTTEEFLVPGDAREWIEFDVNQGLPALRELILTLKDGQGLLINGQVGLTSHVADVVRKAEFPARIVSSTR